MPLIVTPGQLATRGEFYHQLHQLTSAGFGLIQALEQLKRTPPARSYREPIRRLLENLAGGFTFGDSLERLGVWLPAFDVALLQAGEHSGRLDACFKLLADYYQDRARMTRQMIADLAYPIGLFHFAIFILPFAQLFASGDWVKYSMQTLGILVPIYIVLALVMYALQGRHGETWRAWIERVLAPIPILGTARRYLALSRLSAALEALLSAGVTIIEAWGLAATASGSPALRRIVRSWEPQVRAGETPAEAVVASGRFPELFSHQYATGEISGKLDETLKRLHQYYLEEGTRKLRAVAQWTPRFVYLFVALMIAFRVVQFYTNYFQQVRDAGGF
jgi:type II secretory pathway component PulF